MWIGSRTRAARRTQISGPDPLLLAIGTANPSERLLTLLHPLIELTGFDQVATSTGIGGSTTRRSALAICSRWRHGDPYLIRRHTYWDGREPHGLNHGRLQCRGLAELAQLDGPHKCQDDEQGGEQRNNDRPHRRIGGGEAAHSGQAEREPDFPRERERADEDQCAADAEEPESNKHCARTAGDGKNGLGDTQKDEADTQDEGQYTSPFVHGVTP